MILFFPRKVVQPIKIGSLHLVMQPIDEIFVQGKHSLFRSGLNEANFIQTAASGLISTQGIGGYLLQAKRIKRITQSHD